MIQAFYSAASGMQSQQFSMDTSSNNIANIQTAGFKKSRVSFSDLSYSTMNSPVAGKAGIQYGNGSRADSTSRSFLQGALISSDHPLDLAIEGAGFFTVENGMGEHFYTRDGNFRLSAEPEGSFLVTARGDYVLDTDGNRILLPSETDTIVVDSTGSVKRTGLNAVRIGLQSFSNPDGLEAIGGNLFRETPASGGPVNVGTGAIRQYRLEASNVDLLEEMTGLIRTQRAFQLNSRIVQSADEMEGTANNLRA